MVLFVKKNLMLLTCAVTAALVHRPTSRLWYSLYNIPSSKFLV